MERDTYLQRIKFTNTVAVDDKTLAALHEHHVFHVPFENLDIHYKRVFDLAAESVYRKVVIDLRGGFCYELNSLFNRLLLDIGFNSRIISSRIIDDGNLGPEYDHMSICVEVNHRRYLADVGYGDLFIRPIEIKEGIQSDGRSLFKIEERSDHNFLLSMSYDKINFQEKYRFNLSEVSLDKFVDICLEKQINSSSYFVKNTVCTKPTSTGRLTLFIGKLIEKKDNERIEKSIRTDDELRSELRDRFGVVIR